jgi:hypothetical protein
LFLKPITKLTQNVLKSINWHSQERKKFHLVPLQFMKQVMVLSKLIPFVEKWMNPQTVAIRKEMPFKITTFLLTTYGAGFSKETWWQLVVWLPRALSPPPGTLYVCSYPQTARPLGSARILSPERPVCRQSTTLLLYHVCQHSDYFTIQH